MTLNDKIEHAENRSRRVNLRKRGIPEAVTDVLATSLAIFQELAPNIPVIEREHRDLTKKRETRPPEKNVVKLLYYRSKERLLEAARNKG